MGNSVAGRIAAVALFAIGAGACFVAGQSKPPAPPKSGDRSAAGPSASKSAPQGHTYRMKLVKAVDEHAFERPMAAYTILVPTDWQSEGNVTWNLMPYDRCNTTQITLRASGPDGRGLETLPYYNWVWNDFAQISPQAQALQGPYRPCDVQPPMAAADYIRRMLAQIRPNAQVLVIEPAPKLLEKLQQQTRQMEQDAARYGLQQRVRPDAARARLKYELNGKPVEEWVYAFTLTTAKPGLNLNPLTMQMVQSYSYNCSAHMTTQRAPEGQLDASDKFYELIWSTARVNPEWSARVVQNALAMQQIELKGIRDRSRIISQSAHEISDMQMQGWQNRQRSEDRMFDSISQSIRGVETYRNPATGETIDLSNEYGHAWVNNRGEYLLSDLPDFNPSVTLKEEWKELERVRR